MSVWTGQDVKASMWAARVALAGFSVPEQPTQELCQHSYKKVTLVRNAGWTPPTLVLFLLFMNRILRHSHGEDGVWFGEPLVLVWFLQKIQFCLCLEATSTEAVCTCVKRPGWLTAPPSLRLLFFTRKQISLKVGGDPLPQAVQESGNQPIPPNHLYGCWLTSLLTAINATCTNDYTKKINGKTGDQH